MERDLEMLEFEREALTFLVMLEERKRDNPVSYEKASQYSIAIVEGKDDLPSDLLKKEE